MKPIDEANEMLQRARRKQAAYPAKQCGPGVALMAARWVEDLEEFPRLLREASEAAREEERAAIERMVECAIGFAETEDNGLVPLKYADWLSRAELLTAIRARGTTNG